VRIALAAVLDNVWPHPMAALALWTDDDDFMIRCHDLAALNHQALRVVQVHFLRSLFVDDLVLEKVEYLAVEPV
jgi:hypothetical protein